MSQDQLENDAKLITGYNPNSTVNTMVEKTNQAIESVTSSPGYQEVLDNFMAMGKSYVSAVNDGLGTETTIIVNSIKTMVESCVTAIKDKQPEWQEAGKYLVEGFAKGIRDNIHLAVEAANELADATSRGTSDTLMIASPSKVFTALGMYAVQGLANGLINNSSIAEEASSSVGKGIVTTLQRAIQQAAETAHSELDMQPTIRPVLDLSNIEAGRMKLNTMFSRAQAMAVSARLSKDPVDERQKGATDSKAGNTYQFTQINNSPKALSRSEIYRQTKNQFTALKEVLE
jgi:hypothetical protein